MNESRPIMTALLLLVLLTAPKTAQPARGRQPQSPSAQPSSYYVYNGATLRSVPGDPARASFTAWQAWLYPQNVSGSNRTASSLAYTRWAVIEGFSARAVAAQLIGWRNFELAYKKVFGQAAWGRFSFSYTVEPIAIAKNTSQQSSESLSQITLLNGRLTTLVAHLLPSLENADPSHLSPLLQGYFAQVRDSLQDAARLSSDLDHLPSQRSYLNLQLTSLSASVAQAESTLPQVQAALPTVELPAETTWMTHIEQQGSDGAVEVNITEVGAAAWIRQNWSGGDGSMAGTVSVTIVPYQDIGMVDVWVLPLSRGRWTLRLGSASSAGFPESLTSPERKVDARTYPAVDLQTGERNLYLEFSDPADAQDAFNFFLYHKERGR